jgi:phage-related baseplate assembly protein
MYENLEKQLSSLKEPLAFNIKTFDEILSENISLAKEVLGSDWLPLESDPYMKKLRVLTLRQLHNQADKKETVKQLLVTTATGVNLDNLGASENVFRDGGEFPYANFEFKLLVQRDEQVVIPRGLVLNDDDDLYRARVVEDVIIPAGELSGVSKVELESFVVESDVKTENIVTELPFGVDVKQLEIFKNGATAESDDRYRLRIIASNDRYSTAGSVEAYTYHAVSADSRIDDIVVLDENVLDVNIYLASFSCVDDLMINRVYEACNKRYVRPLGDNLIVKPAEIVELNISATIELFDLLKQGEIDTAIRANFENSFFIGQDFVRSDFIRKCHIDGVYRVDTDFNDVIVNNKQIIKIKSLSLNFVEAEL